MERRAREPEAAPQRARHQRPTQRIDPATVDVAATESTAAPSL
jgi:hypothetical protein